jgi:hypothetical protein
MTELPTIRALADLVDLVTERPVYLRYSDGPDTDDGPSLDYESGVELPGLSVTTLAPEPWWTRSAEDWIARRLCKYAELGSESGRFAWILCGREVGRGPDHEPVVTDITPVAVIDEKVIDEAKRVYRRRFEVAQDSRCHQM